MVKELNVFIDILTCTTSGTFQQLFNSARLVKSATIQNLTTTAGTQITITTIRGGSSNGIKGATAKGFVLNPGTGNGTAGGAVTYPAHDYGPDLYVDLSTIAWTASKTNAQISVEYEMFGGNLQL